MSAARRQAEEAIQDAAEQIEGLVAQSGLSWGHDAMFVLREALADAIKGACLLCHAEPDGAGHCPVDGSPHAWAPPDAAAA